MVAESRSLKLGKSFARSRGARRRRGQCHPMAFIPGLKGSRRVASHLGIYPKASAQWFMACCLRWVPDFQTLVPTAFLRSLAREGIGARLRVRTVSPMRLRPGRWLESPVKQGSFATLSVGFRAPASFPQITESRGDVCVDLLGELGLQD